VKFTEQQKKVMRWLGFNVGTLISLLLGIIYGIPMLEALGVAILWIAAIVGTTMGIIVKIAANMLVENKVNLIIEPYSNLPEKEHEDRKTIYFSEESVLKLTQMSVPKWVDATFDFGIVILLAYFDFAWLPIVYLMHMVALVYTRDLFENLYLNIENYRMPVTIINEDDLDLSDPSEQSTDFRTP